MSYEVWRETDDYNHCIVTGDKDLLDPGVFEGIGILAPADFRRFEAGFTTACPCEGKMPATHAKRFSYTF